MSSFGQSFSGAFSSGLGGGFASAAGGLIGGVISGINARGNMRRQQRYNKELLKLQNDYATEQADAAYEREKDFYNIQNAYNNPSAVRERYEAAGINVNSAFGTAGSYTPNQSSPSVPQADTISPPYQNADVTFGDPLEAAYKMAMINNINAQTDKTKSEIGDRDEFVRAQVLANNLAAENIISKQLANRQAEFDYQFAQDIRDLNIKNLIQRTSNLEAQYLNMAAEYEKTRADANLSQEKIKEINSIVNVNAARVGYFKALEKQADSNRELDKLRARLMISEADFNDSKTLLTKLESLTELERPNYIRQSAEYQKSLADFQSALKDFKERELKVAERNATVNERNADANEASKAAGFSRDLIEGAEHLFSLALLIAKFVPK